MDYFLELFSSKGFMPHGFCYQWTPALIWSSVVSDIIITLAYFSIPFALMYFVHRRKDLQFNWVFKSFSLFILSCGITHLLGIWTIWYPDYWFEVLAKEMTAFMSLFTAIMLWPLIPQLLKLPSTHQLEDLVANLEREVAQRKSNEAELIRLKSLSDERFRMIFESTRDALVLFTPDGSCKEGNPAAYAMYECASVEELVAMTPQSRAPEFQPDGSKSDEKITEIINLTMQNGSHVFEWTHKRKNGTEFPVEALLTRIQMGNDSMLVSNTRDISERKLVEKSLLDADQRKDEFLAMLAHELRNPLTPISNVAQILAIPQIDEARVKWAQQIIARQVVHLTRLVDDLLDVSRISTGKIILKKERFELAEFVNHVVTLVSDAVKAKQHTLDVHLPDNPVLLFADQVRMTQILSNLVDNAIKYSPDGGLISIKVYRIGYDIQIEVQDQGVGISPELLPRVFELFKQSESSLDRSQGGLGIGLTLVKGLVKLHGGQVTANSAGVGSGSTFIVRLPIVAETVSSPETITLEVAQQKKTRILLVDDDFYVRESTAMNLELNGFEVRAADGGDAAIKLIADFHPEVILLDIGLPGEDGYLVCRRIRRLPTGQDIVVIALTGYGHPEALARTKAEGFDYHLIKPVNVNTFSVLLAKLGVRNADTKPSNP